MCHIRVKYATCVTLGVLCATSADDQFRHPAFTILFSFQADIAPALFCVNICFTCFIDGNSLVSLGIKSLNLNISAIIL